MISLYEANRSDLLNQARSADNYSQSNQALGRNRFERRLHSRVANTVKEYNQIDMNKLFKEDILDVNINVHGETNDYLVKIKMGGFLENLKQIVSADVALNLRDVIRALVKTFNSDNVYIHCECPDWKYRMAYFATKNDINSGNPENIPSDDTNPNDTKGPGCKHSLLCLSNNTWLMKVASVITNYVKYMEKHYKDLYASIIYPAIHGQKYKEIQDIEDEEDADKELDTDVGTIDTSNKYARIKNLKQFRDKEIEPNIQDNQVSDSV